MVLLNSNSTAVSKKIDYSLKGGIEETQKEKECFIWPRELTPKIYVQVKDTPCIHYYEIYASDA